MGCGSSVAKPSTVEVEPEKPNENKFYENKPDKQPETGGGGAKGGGAPPAKEKKKAEFKKDEKKKAKPSEPTKSTKPAAEKKKPPEVFKGKWFEVRRAGIRNR